jgi:MHS family proline/betaine transporter-like MFS transporter
MKVNKIIAAALVGHVLEFYDFTVYAVFSVVIGELFFPKYDPFSQILSSLAVFAVGFFMRPIGGILFGHIGDKYGRRAALTVAIVGMAAATTLIGFMPTYSEIGIIAPISLVVLRLIQGTCVGGEGAGASIFVLEHLKNIKPGLIGGMINAALTLGILLAIIVGMALNTIFNSEQEAWRYAFFIGGMMGIVGLYIRIQIEETPEFEQRKKEDKLVKIPIISSYKNYPKYALMTIVVGALTGATGYTIMTYITIFFQKVMNLNPQHALLYGGFANLSLIMYLPIMGMISDRIGYAKTIAFSCIMLIFCSTPLYQMLASGDQTLTILAINILALIVAGTYAPLYPFIINFFPVEYRYSAIACNLNIGIALCGGTCSIINLYLIEATSLLYAPAFYLNALSLIFLCTLYLTDRRSFISLFKRTINNEQLQTETKSNI